MDPIITKNEADMTITIERTFAAPLSKVWKAWTTSEQLDKWWGPKPWNAVTKSFDFSEGGRWLYNMMCPDGTATWCLIDYKTIDPEKSFTSLDAFCDEQGTINTDMPSTNWKVEFTEHKDKTKVLVTLSFDSSKAMNTLIEMGFKEGFTMGLNQLEELLAN